MDISAICAFCSSPVVRRQQAQSANVKLHFCNLSCKASYQRLAKPVGKEWLIEHYVNRGMDCVQIGRIVNRDPKSVWNWMRDFGIPTRPRGACNKLPEEQRKRYIPKPPRPTNDPGKEVLVSMYCEQMMPAREIAERLGRSQNSILRWLKRHQIRIRTLKELRFLDGHVPYLKNGTHHLKNGRPENHPNWKGGASPERQAFYSTAEWRECVKAVWARDDAKCRRCGLDHRTILRGTVRFELHHIDSFSIKERRAAADNVVLLCERCHLWVHSRKNKRKVLLGKGH